MSRRSPPSSRSQPSRRSSPSLAEPVPARPVIAEPPSARSDTRSVRVARGLGGWLDERTGYRAWLKARLEAPVRGGASWAYVWGTLLLFVLINQAVTGVLLASSYGPTAADAWASVAFIQDQVRLGWFVRGLHSAGASSLYVVLLLHLLQVTLYGAYRAPREVNWLTGVVLCGLVAGFGVTGYQLPWDQHALGAAQVVTTLLGSVPLWGDTLQALLQGGSGYGNLTLARGYALHVFVLPALTLLFALGHVALFRRHGVTPHPDRARDELLQRSEPRWPRQILYELGGALALLALLVGLVVRSHGADLGAPADPSASYQARPEWYFLPLYELLKLTPGALSWVTVVVVPLLVFGGLAALPFLRLPRRRPLALVGGGVGIALALGALARYQDARDPGFQQDRARAAALGERARRLAREGVPPGGGMAVYLNDPLEQGRRIFVTECLRCHPLRSRDLDLLMGGLADDDREKPGVDLSGFGTRAWIAGFLRDPNAPRYFGTTKIHGMKPVRGSAEELRALTEYVYSLAEVGPVAGSRADAALAGRGRVIFEARECDVCHERDGKTEGEGPNLQGFAGVAWIRDLLAHPASPLNFAAQNEMPAFGDKLNEEELARLAAFIAAQRAVP